MAAALVATTQAGSGQSATVSSLGIPIPSGAAVGDETIIFINSSDSALAFTTPTGWTLLDGPRANGTSQGTAVLSKTLASGEPGSTLTITFTSGAARVDAHIYTVTGVPGTGILLAFAQDTAAVTSFVMATQTGVTAGSFQIAEWLRRRSGVAGTITVPSPYTQPATSGVATSYASAVNVFSDSGYVASSGSGTVGGETATSGTSSLGTNYLVIIPAGAAFSGSLAVTGVGTLTLGQTAATAAGSLAVTGVGSTSFGAIPKTSGSLAVTGVGTLALSGSPRPAGSLAVTGVGSLALAGTPRVPGSLAVTGVGSLVFASNTGAGSLAVTGVGALVLAGLLRVSGSLAVTGVGSLAISGKPNPRGTLTFTGIGALTFTGIFTARLKWWTGAAWQSGTVKYWDGSAWQNGTVKVWDGAAWT